MVSELIGKYIWLIQIINASGGRGLSLRDITSRYERRYDQPYSRRTFNNHRQAILEVFGIDIVCDRATNRYSIPGGEDVMDDDRSTEWLINTFTVNNLLSLGKGRLSGRVSVEEIPSGHRFLTSIMQAMEEDMELEIVYGKYSNSYSETLHVLPYAVKEHERRWYLVAFCRERNGMRVYGLDRIASLEETGETFRMPRNFDVDDLFSESFGIYYPKEGQKSVTVKFRATEEESRYLRDLPMHKSQKEEGPTEGGGSVFRLRLIPDENLVMEFCRLAGRVEVLEPEELRSSVKDALEKGYESYE